MTLTTHDECYTFAGYYGTESTCDMTLYTREDGTMVAIAESLTGTSVRNKAEPVYLSLLKEYGLLANPEGLKFVIRFNDPLGQGRKNLHLLFFRNMGTRREPLPILTGYEETTMEGLGIE